MGVIKTRVFERVIMGLNKGGQIPAPIIGGHFSDACEQFYEYSEAVKTDLPAIDEVKNETIYRLPPLPNKGRVCRAFELKRNGVRLDASEYRMQLIVPPSEGVEAYEAIVISRGSPETKKNSLVLSVVTSYANDNFIPHQLREDAEVAITALVMTRLCMETGKPWSNPQKAMAEEARFRISCGMAKHKVMRGYGGGSLRMQRSNLGFVV